jgi:hypothetical protein
MAEGQHPAHRGDTRAAGRPSAVWAYRLGRGRRPKRHARRSRPNEAGWMVTALIVVLAFGVVAQPGALLGLRTRIAALIQRVQVPTMAAVPNGTSRRTVAL